MKNCIWPKSMVIKPNPSSKSGTILGNVKNEAVSCIGVLRDISSVTLN